MSTSSVSLPPESFENLNVTASYCNMFVELITFTLINKRSSFLVLVVKLSILINLLLAISGCFLNSL